MPQGRPPFAFGTGGLARGADAAVVTFTGGNYTGWETWDWDTITHLGFWTNPPDEVHAKARASGVRLFGDAGLPDKATWTNESAR